MSDIFEAFVLVVGCSVVTIASIGMLLWMFDIWCFQRLKGLRKFVVYLMRKGEFEEWLKATKG